VGGKDIVVSVPTPPPPTLPPPSSKRKCTSICPVSIKKAKNACIKELRAKLAQLDAERTELINTIDGMEKFL
jgi:hypothetical protein